MGWGAYAEELDVIKHMVVVREVVARDNVYTGILPESSSVARTQPLSFGKELITGELVTPSMPRLPFSSHGLHPYGETQELLIEPC